MKAVILSLALAALVSAQNITLIPTGISSECNTLLQSINNDTTLSTCVQPLITATASFNPLSGANLSASDINYSLAAMCKGNTGCTDGVIRTWLSRFYASCSAELTNPTSYNAQVRELYDILYVVNPLKGAVCSIDSANQQYCVNQVIGVGKNSTGPSGNKTGVAAAGLASASGSASASSVSLASAASSASGSAVSSASSASASFASVSSASAASASGSASSVSSAAASASVSATGLATNALFASFASSWSPVQFAADNLYIAYTSASQLSRRMIEMIPRADGDATQATLATVITPNATTYRSTNLPFLFLQPSFNADRLCTPCTREIMVAYIKWETAVPYALGLAQSPILGGQMELWSAIDQTCGSTYVAAINAQVGQFVGISNSSSSALSVLAAPGGGLGSAVFGAAVLAGAVAYMV